MQLTEQNHKLLLSYFVQIQIYCFKLYMLILSLFCSYLYVGYVIRFHITDIQIFYIFGPICICMLMYMYCSFFRVRYFKTKSNAFQSYKMVFKTLNGNYGKTLGQSFLIQRKYFQVQTDYGWLTVQRIRVIHSIPIKNSNDRLLNNKHNLT